MKVVLQNTVYYFPTPPPLLPPPPIYSNSLPNYTKQYESDFEFTTWRSVHHIKSNTLKNTKYYFPHTYFHLKIFSEYANICLCSYIRKTKRRYPSYRKDLHSNQVSSIENMLLVKQRTKFMKQSKDIKKNWTGAESFDICFCIFSNH